MLRLRLVEWFLKVLQARLPADVEFKLMAASRKLQHGCVTAIRIIMSHSPNRRTAAPEQQKKWLLQHSAQ